MTRYTQRNAGTVRDRRVTVVAVGLTVVAAFLLSPLASDAASGQGDLSAGTGTANLPEDPTGPDAQPTQPDPGVSDTQPVATGSESAPSEPEPGQGTDSGAAPGSPPASDSVDPASGASPADQQPSNGTTPPTGGEALGNTCEGSALEAHDGFQNGNRCVSTEFGEVGNAETNPSLLITSAPRFVRADRPFDLRVNTRNLVRDRFLGAAAGGYYKESSFLNADGLVRGHFHTACRMLTSGRTAPDPAPVPAFFVATEDGAGGATPDTVRVRVSGLPRGLAQCAVWAGDGSHRIPMMQRANQVPAFDAVRIRVR